MRRLCCGLIVCWLSSAAGAVPRLVAPETVHDLLRTHLSLAEFDGTAPDAIARLALERRLRKEAGELLGLSSRTLKRDFRRARAFLHARLGDGGLPHDAAD